MATAESCELGPLHAPKEGSIAAFSSLIPDLKKRLVIMRHKHSKHDAHYFDAVSHLSDTELVQFDEKSLESVRVGQTAYGIHIFGKVRLPHVDNAYIHVRMYVGEDGGDKTYKLHSIFINKDGKLVLTAEDDLDWFNE